MSTGVCLAVIVGSVFVIAAVWVAVTNRPDEPGGPRLAVAWLRVRDYRIAHTFRTAELDTVELSEGQALAVCGWWPVVAPILVTELVADDGALRCAACERAMEAMQVQHQQ